MPESVRFCGDFVNGMFVGLDGKVVKKDKFSYPYSYDPFVLWKNKEYEAKEYYMDVYSDRLRMWDNKKFNVCSILVWGKVVSDFGDKKPKDIESFLSLYFCKELILVKIIEYCNVSSGAPYWRFFLHEGVKHEE
ncbi:hypothetical protein D3C81_09690 [compost metagenome]